MCAHQVRSYGPTVTADDHSTDGPAGGAAGHDSTTNYELRVQGHLGSRWSAWFDGLTVTRNDDGTTVICGAVVDQAALHGLLSKLRDVGIPLLSLTQLPPDAPTEPSAPESTEGN